MNEMTVFQNEQFGEIRTVERDGEPWFVAADVCRALEIGNGSLRYLPSTAGEGHPVTIINSRIIPATQEEPIIFVSGIAGEGKEL